MPDINEFKPGENDLPDLFTRLSIAMCPEDDGTRPVNPNWPLCDIGWLSPAMAFSSFPLFVGQPSTATIHIKNFGTMDATGAWLETAYNVWIGNQAQGMTPVQNMTLPIIPAGGEYTASLVFTPPDSEAIHACFHARVFDTFSLFHFPSRCMEWSSFVNPQAGHRNTILIKIEQPDKPLAVTFKTRNFLPGQARHRALITAYDSRTRFRDLDERFPLPFVFSGEADPPLRLAERPGPGDAQPSRGYLRTLENVAIGGERLAGPIASERTAGLARLWPRETVRPEFIHERFGFDLEDAVAAPGGYPATGTGFSFLPGSNPALRLKSMRDIQLSPGEERYLRIVIPPREFPPRGRRKRFQVDYQLGNERPVQYFIYLQH